MAFCATCGAEVQGRFCAKCGAPAAAAGPSQAAPPSAAPAGLTENVASALCYVLTVLTGILFLVLAPYNQNKTIRFHAWQSIFLWVAAVIASIAVSILTGIFLRIPFIGWMVDLLLWPAFGIGMFILWLMLMYKAYNNERLVLPVIGPLAEKQA
jgi:uncharacterized membrane protein